MEGSANIEITALPNDKYYVSGSAVYIGNAELGQMNMGELDGAFSIENNRPNYSDSDADGCQLEIQFFDSKLVVSGDNTQCGGLNVSFDGEYMRVMKH